ncbi:MAG: hypothetical protein OEL85_09410 [Desulfobulbaceae bacterium]|nr:hypothetical protein [Desulfobulbaceae bacterium]
MRSTMGHQIRGIGQANSRAITEVFISFPVETLRLTWCHEPLIPVKPREQEKKKGAVQ